MNNQEDIKKLIENLSMQAENEIEKVFAARLVMILDEFEKMFEKYQIEDVHVSWAEFNKYNRLNKELERIAEAMTLDYQKVAQLVKNTQYNVYIEKYLRSLYLFEYSSDIPMDFTVPDKATIIAAIENPIKYIRLTPTLQKQRNEVLRKIRANITEGVLNGDSYKKVAKRIEHDVGISSSKAKRVARTETGRAQSIAGYEAAKKAQDNGVDMGKVWNATKDLRTRRSHAHLDGKKIGIDESFSSRGCKGLAPHLFVGANSASENINCRCDILFLVEGEEPDVMRVRNENGKGSKIVPYQTYKDWYKNKTQGR